MTDLRNPSLSDYSELTGEDLKIAKTMTELWFKPEEHFNTIIDSGMCNDIIAGYILLLLDKMTLDNSQKKNANDLIFSLFDNYTAQQARNRYRGIQG